MNEVEKLRHAAEQRYVSLGQGAEKFGGVQRLEENHASAAGQRNHQVRHLRQRVEQRQHAENRVRVVEAYEAKDRFHLAAQVGMREHYALGIAGGSGGVEDAGNIIGLGGGRGETFGSGLVHLSQRGQFGLRREIGVVDQRDS